MSKIILGGGISGLSAAHYLIKKHPAEPLSLIEASNRVGGWLKSTIHEDGTIFEQGPRTIRPRGFQGANTLKLIEDLKLSDKIRPIFSSHPAATNRMIYANKELHKLPSSFGSIFKKQKPFSKPLIAYLLTEYFKPAKKIADESIYDFVTRRFGREIGDYLISPMICGICGGNAKEISVNFLMESLFDKEQKYGSISNGLVRSTLGKKTIGVEAEISGLSKRAAREKWSVYSFDGGIEILPKALNNEMVKSGVEIALNRECINIEFGDEVVLNFRDGKILKTDRLISSIPAEKLAELVDKQHPGLAVLLRKIENVSLGVVNIKYKRKLIENEGFGFLVAPKENLPILGVIYDSCCFPNGENTVLTSMMGGYWFKQHFGDDPKEDVFIGHALEQIKNILKIDLKPDDYKVNILKNCIPQYKVGHKDNLAKIHDYIKTHNLALSLCGASYNGVGVNDVILSAKKAVDDL